MEPGHPCCTPARSQERVPTSAVVTPTPAPDRHGISQARVPAGSFAMGDSTGDGNPGDGEWPVHEVRLEEFSIDVTTVTNDDFAVFVADTGFRTEAETFGFSAVFHLALAAPVEDVLGQPAQTPWWLGVRSSDWRHPGGSRSDLDGLSDHPVVHVNWNDAAAYAAWAGRRLPSEAEWEHASRGGLPGARYPWGNDLLDEAGGWRCNIWQGRFPASNSLDDWWVTTAPVESFSPNGYGLFETVGNVWEWCADWWSATTYASSVTENPHGPNQGSARVMRGGSYLCHDSYCNRYRNAARSSNTADSSSGNTGFRTVAF